MRLLHRSVMRWTAAAAVVLAASVVAAQAVAAQGLIPTSGPTATIVGTVVSHNRGAVTIEQPGTSGGRINAMVAYANRLAAKRYRYVFGGGHRHVQVPDTGTGHGTRGFDCSGAVAAVLASAGLWPKGRAVPNDRGVIEDLLRAKVIAAGASGSPYAVNLFDLPNRDVQMSIEGDFFGTGFTARGGPTWMGDEPTFFPGYREYHVVPAVLDDSRSFRHLITFQFANPLLGFSLAKDLHAGAKVQVTYRTHGGGLWLAAVKDIAGH
jgi:hypothetical protein